MNCKISKYMPTLVSEVKGGISLICHNDKVNLEEADFLEQLLGCISKVKHTEEKDFEFLSDLTSCGPGLIAALFQELADAAYRRSDNFAMDEIEEILLLTLYGTSDLMLKKEMNFGNVISRVATKGGITEEGVKVIHNELPPVFDEMFVQILKKRKIVSESIQSQLKGDLG
jgi:pyrroline-5-carboxylate reductase